MRKLKIGIFLFLITSSLLGQVVTKEGGWFHHFENLTTEEGLSNDGVYSVYQDRYGFLWFGHLGGIERYDGVRLKKFLHNNEDTTGLFGNEVTFFYEDKTKGDFWIGCRNSGLFKFDREHEKFQYYPEFKSDSSKIRYYANCIAEDSIGNFWIGTTRGLRYFDRSKERFTKSVFLGIQKDEYTLRNIIRSVLIKNNKLWVGTNYGLASIDLNTFEENYVNLAIESNKGIDGFENILTIDLSLDNQLLVGVFSGGILKVNFETLEVTDFLPPHINKKLKPVTSIVIGNDKRYWIGTRNGVKVYDPVLETFVSIDQDGSFPNGIVNTSILDVYKDGFGDIWLGTVGGVSHWGSNMQRFSTNFVNKLDNRCLNGSSISSFLMVDGVLWVASSNGGVNVFDAKTLRYSYITAESPKGYNLLNNDVVEMVDDGKGNIWISCFNDGIAIYDKATKRTRFKTKENTKHLKDGIFDNRIKKFFVDSYGRMWVGTGRGICRYNPDTDNFKYFRDAGITGIVNWIEEDKDSILWIGTYQRMYAIDLKTDSVIYSYLNDFVINSFYQDSKGRCWVGTLGKGLGLFDRLTKKFTFYSIEAGLSNANVYQITEDSKGFLWVSTQKRLNRFDVDSKIFQSYGRKEGVYYDSFEPNASLTLASGEILFGGKDGYIKFNPNTIVDDSTNLKLVISSVKLFGKELIPSVEGPLFKAAFITDTLALHHTQNFISIQFSSLDFGRNSDVKFRYKLDKIDPDWVYAHDANEAVYTNLQGGSYDFVVEVTRNNEEWGKNRRVLKIIVVPPFYKTTAFIVEIIILVLLIVGVSIYFKYRLNAHITARLKEEVHQRTVELEVSYLNILEQKEEILAQNENLTKLSDKVNEQNLELESYAQNLELKVKERTIELESEKFHAEESDRLKSAFLANMSHEIRTPMNGILGFVDLLKTEDLTNEERLNYLDVVEKSGIRMMSIINDVLDLSRIEAGQMPMQLQDVDISQLLNEMRLFFELEAHKRGIELCFAPIKSQITIMFTDRDKLAQILSNLIKNAIKFTSEGSVEVGVRFYKHSVLFRIKDTGIGISESSKRMLFRRFVQGDLSITKKFEGAGLGLFICKSLVNILGGSIRFHSTENKGSAFFVRLPNNSLE